MWVCPGGVVYGLEDQRRILEIKRLECPGRAVYSCEDCRMI
jgi:hypothetical protein